MGTFIDADAISLAAFVLFCIFMLVVSLCAFHKVQAEGYYYRLWIGYLLVFSTVVLLGLPKVMVIPIVPLLFISVIAMALYLGFSQLGQRIATQFTFTALIGFQGFRFLLELALHHWATIGTVPMTMTWTGQNWDVITGIVSLTSIPVLRVKPNNKSIVWIVQLIGFVLLLNVLRVVILSSPFPFAWPLENPLQLIAHFPYALIAPLFVGVALFLHVVVFRKLLSR